MKRVWVIEMLNDATCKWEPCADCALTKRGAAHDFNKMPQWRENNPADKFRVTAYYRVGP